MNLGCFQGKERRRTIWIAQVSEHLQTISNRHMKLKMLVIAALQEDSFECGNASGGTFNETSVRRPNLAITAK